MLNHPTTWATCGLALLIAALPPATSMGEALEPSLADRVEFRPTTGSVLSRHITINNKIELDEYLMEVNGEPPAQVPEMEMTIDSELEYTIEDRFVSLNDEQPQRLVRTFQSLEMSGQTARKLGMRGGEPLDETLPMEGQSALQGRSVRFDWSPEAEEYRREFVEPQEDDESTLLGGLLEDMDLRGLLPGAEVRKGARWPIEVMEFSPIMMPAGDLHFRVETGDSEGNLPGIGELPNPADFFGELLQGRAAGTYRGLRDVGERKLAEIHIALELESDKDATDIIADAMDGVGQGESDLDVELEEMRLEFTFVGEGTLLWDVQAGHAYSFELSGDTTTNIHMRTLLLIHGAESELDFEMKMSGTQSTMMEFTPLP